MPRKGWWDIYYYTNRKHCSSMQREEWIKRKGGVTYFYFNICVLFDHFTLRKAMTNLDSIFKKQRHYFADKGPYSQSYGFCNNCGWLWELDHQESWCQRTDAFELWCWRRLLRVPWTARRSNQSILKEYSLKGLMLKLKLQYFSHLMWRTDSLEKPPMLGKIEGRRRGRQRMRWLHGITD